MTQGWPPTVLWLSHPSNSCPLLSPFHMCRDALSDVWRRLLWRPPGTIRGFSTMCEMWLQRQCGLQRTGNMWPRHWAMSEMPGTHWRRPLPTLPAGLLRQRPEPDSCPEVQTWVTEVELWWIFLDTGPPPLKNSSLPIFALPGASLCRVAQVIKHFSYIHQLLSFSLSLQVA